VSLSLGVTDGGARTNYCCGYLKGQDAVDNFEFAILLCWRRTFDAVQIEIDAIEKRFSIVQCRRALEWYNSNDRLDLLYRWYVVGTACRAADLKVGV